VALCAIQVQIARHSGLISAGNAMAIFQREVTAIVPSYSDLNENPATLCPD
jgi:hypothetical protein